MGNTCIHVCALFPAVFKSKEYIYLKYLVLPVLLNDAIIHVTVPVFFLIYDMHLVLSDIECCQNIWGLYQVPALIHSIQTYGNRCTSSFMN